MFCCVLWAAARACRCVRLAEEAHHRVSLLEAAADGAVRHGNPQCLLRDGIPGSRAIRCHCRYPDSSTPSQLQYDSAQRADMRRAVAVQGSAVHTGLELSGQSLHAEHHSSCLMQARCSGCWRATATQTTMGTQSTPAKWQFSSRRQHGRSCRLSSWMRWVWPNFDVLSVSPKRVLRVSAVKDVTVSD